MTRRIICKSNIHHATVTGADLRYIGSIGDTVVIAAFYLADEPVEPRMIAVDERNAFVRSLGHDDMENLRFAQEPVAP